ncbi:MAG: hypothetical protein GC160_14610 [Acidobacteria bacterium]|nr:hypothetical protein [Acidobacteriota bacterium]
MSRPLVKLLAKLLAVCAGAACAVAAPLPLGEIPSGGRFLVIQPHHDDHTWQYGHGGFIAKLVDAGWKGVYVRASNDEKDGSSGWGRNDQINESEAIEATSHLGIEKVVSLNWRNDHMSSIPGNELRTQLILLIRELKPDIVMSYNPWGHYDRNPDHRKVARAVGEAIWLSGFATVNPEHAEVGAPPWRVPHAYFSQRSDYGKGYEPNVAIELNAEQVARKGRAYWLHRNVRLNPATARSIRAKLDAQGLEIPELEGLDDEKATEKLQEWFMEWISRKRGEENGVEFAEVFFHVGEWRAVPGLRRYLEENVQPR